MFENDHVRDGDSLSAMAEVTVE